VRASDAEREETVARLHDALGEGRLDLAETEERVAAAYATRYRAQFAPLLADLPDAPDPGSDVQSWSAIWAQVVWRARIALGVADPAGTRPPTPGQCRSAAALAVLAATWMMVCAVLGAALVAS
jgi:hypothetical protein